MVRSINLPTPKQNMYDMTQYQWAYAQKRGLVVAINVIMVIRSISGCICTFISVIYTPCSYAWP